MLTLHNQSVLEVFEGAESIYRVKKTSLNNKNQDFTSKIFTVFRHLKLQKVALKTTPIKYEEMLFCSTKEIKSIAVEYFGTLYRQRRVPISEDHLELISGFPVMFSEYDNLNLFGAVTVEEVKRVLKSFAADKSPGPRIFSCILLKTL